MEKNDSKIFVLPSLGLMSIRSFIERNYPKFSIIHLDFDYDRQLDKWRIFVDMKSEPLSFTIISMRSNWLSNVAFFEEYRNMQSFILDIDELPF